MTNQRIAKKLSKYQLVLTNATDPEILKATTNFNYTAEKITEGTGLLSTAQQQNIQQGKEYGEQYSATEKLNEAIQKFHSSLYIPHLKLARKLFPNDPGIRASLCLDGSRKASYDEWSNEANLFYANALSTPKIKTRFALVNITEEVLQSGIDQLTQISQLRATQRNEFGEAQQATDMRDKALDEINEWMSLYFTVAKIALADKPQLLEKLGIKA